MEKIFSNNIVKIFSDTEKKLLIQRWNSSYPTLAEFEESMEASLNYFKKNECRFIISDTRLQPCILNECMVNAQIKTELLKQYGLSKMAFWVSDDMFFQQSINLFKHRITEVAIDLFLTEEEIYEWLLEM